SNGYQTIDELIHSRLAQRDFGADCEILANLESCDRLASLGNDCLLAGDLLEIGDCDLNEFRIGCRLADAHVQNHLLKTGHLHGVLVAELLGELRPHDLIVMLAQARSISFNHRSSPGNAWRSAPACHPPASCSLCASACRPWGRDEPNSRCEWLLPSKLSRPLGPRSASDVGAPS